MLLFILSVLCLLFWVIFLFLIFQFFTVLNSSSVNLFPISPVSLCSKCSDRHTAWTPRWKHKADQSMLFWNVPWWAKMNIRTWWKCNFKSTGSQPWAHTPKFRWNYKSKVWRLTPQTFWARCTSMNINPVVVTSYSLSLNLNITNF